MKKWVIISLLALVVVVGVVVGLGGPVIGPFTAQAVEPYAQTVNTAPITTTTNFQTHAWPAEAEYADVFMSLDMPTVNTATFTIQTSPDGALWATPPNGTLWTSQITDTDAVTTVMVSGLVYRLQATVSSTPTFTPSLYITFH